MNPESEHEFYNNCSSIVQFIDKYFDSYLETKYKDSINYLTEIFESNQWKLLIVIVIMMKLK